MDILEIEKIIIKEGFLTGSRAWCVNNSASDYDYVLYGTSFYGIKGILDESGFVFANCYNNSIKLVIHDKEYNLFTGIRGKVDNIKTTTEILRAYPKSILNNKKQRVYIFENTMSLLKNFNCTPYL